MRTPQVRPPWNTGIYIGNGTVAAEPKMKLRNIAVNQTEIALPNGTYIFFSYATPVAAFIPGTGVWREEDSSSRTTAKHITQWATRNFPGATVTKVPVEEIETLLPS